MAVIRFNKLFYDVVILLLIFHIGNASILNTRSLPFTLGVILIFNHIFINKQAFNRKFIMLLAAWLVINIISFNFNGVSGYIPRLVINTINLLFLPYVLIKRLGLDFWARFEKLIYYLTVISIPLYLLSLVVPGYFNGMKSVFAPYTSPGFLEGHNYWSAVFYNHANFDNGYGIMRNCGFMWEPGAFSMMVVWAIIYNWLKSEKMKFDRKILVYIFALATTFSTGGYFALTFLIVGFNVKKFSFVNLLLLIGSIFIFYFYIYQLNFVSGKLDNYIESYKDDPTGERGYTGKKVNRLQGGVTAFTRTLKYPLGYGLISTDDTNDQNYSYGTNGLASLLELWGVFLFPFLMFLFYKCLKMYDQHKANKMTMVFFFTGLMAVFISNPIHRSIFIYFMIITPLAISYRVNNHTIDQV